MYYKNGKVMETNKIEDVKKYCESGYIFEIDNTEMIDKMFIKKCYNNCK